VKVAGLRDAVRCGLSMPDGFFTDPGDLAKLARARTALARNNQLFRAVEARALSTDDPEKFARRAVVALDRAIHRHPGMLVSTKLEQRLSQVGQECLGGRQRAKPSNGVDHVLHVLTAAYESGGHTRVTERWMREDRGRVSSVLITGRTASRSVPTTLDAAARASGGAVIPLKGGDLLARASNMREIVCQYDLIVLHIHMHDVVPVIALANPVGRPPTILFNHANHTIWVGVGVADVVASLQEVDARNALTRRGVPPQASFILPIPVSTRDLPTRADARRRLGLDDRTPLILAVGPKYKMRGIVSPHFTEVAARLVDPSIGAKLIAIGPEASGEWADLERVSGGRARAIGVHPNPVVNMYMSAADVLLDSWPITGGATVVDAGYSRLPVVSIGDGRTEMAVVRPPADALGGAILHASSIDAVERTVADLLHEPERREALGNQSHAYVDDRQGSGWARHLERAVEAALARAGKATPPILEPAPQYTDWECLLYLAYAGEVGNPLVERVRDKYRWLHRQVLDDTARKLDRFL
jgi:hypothetical protein